MAHRKRKTKHKHHKARRIGAMALNPNQPVIKLAAVALGYFLAADPLNSAIDKAVPVSISTATDFKKYIPGAVEGGIGALLLLSKKKPSLIKTGIGGILAGAALKRLLLQTGAITGYQATPVIGMARRHRMAGYQSVPVVGVTTPPQLSGKLPAQLEGYRVNGYRPHGSGVMGSINGVGHTDPFRGSGITYGDSSGYMG